MICYRYISKISFTDPWHNCSTAKDKMEESTTHYTKYRESMAATGTGKLEVPPFYIK